MIILLSPAKSLDYDSPLPDVARQAFETGNPQGHTSGHLFESETQKLVSAASNLSKKRLKEIMPVSDKLIDLNHGRYKNFFEQEERPAIFAFNGDVYTGFEAKSLDDAALAYAQNHVRILSGLYGLLAPLDNMRPYRLEMGTRWAPRYKSLVAFWGEKISDHLDERLENADEKIIINLASKEYFAAVEKGLKKRNIRVIDIDFRQETASGLKFNSFAAKKARGMAARYMCDHHHDHAEALKGFDYDGYQFKPENSSENSWHFVRKSTA